MTSAPTFVTLRPWKRIAFGFRLRANAPEGQSDFVPQSKPKPKWRRRGRQLLPEGLPRKRIEYELSAEELPCLDCGHPRTKIGEEASPEDTDGPRAESLALCTRLGAPSHAGSRRS